MSVRIMTQVWSLDIPSHLKLVLLAIADSANDDGFCWPGQQTIAEKCSLTTRAARKNLATLQEMGLVEAVQRGKKQTNTYQIVIGTTVPVTLQGDRNSSTSSDRNHSSGPQEPSVEPSVKTAPTARVLIKNALVEAMGWNPKSVTRSQWGAIEKAAKDLAAVNATPDQIIQRARIYPTKQPGKLSPSALAKWWADCEPPSLNGCPNRCGPDGFYHPNDHPYPVPCPNPGCETKRKVKGVNRGT